MIPVYLLSPDPNRREMLWSDRIEAALVNHGFRLTDDLEETEGLITTWGSPLLTAEWLDKMPKLRIVGHAAGSVRPIATPQLFERGITLFSANPLLAETVSEWAVLATLMLQRRVLNYSKLRAGEHANWGGFQSFRDIHDTVIGIWGFGDIAKAYIKRICAFEPAKILVYSGHASNKELASYGAVKANSFEELLENCDQLHCLTGQTPQNLGMLNADKLRLLRDGAEIVNCGRPGLMDYDALFKECQSGRLTAMLDVLPGDPAKEPVKLDELSNVIITPHCAGASGRKRYIPWILEQFNRFFSGEKDLPGMVSAERTLTMTIETPNLKKG
jgi:phosphoglycerate dehydrogenase-like enzyme